MAFEKMKKQEEKAFRQHLLSKIKLLMGESDLTYNMLAQRAGVSCNMLVGVINERLDASVGFLMKVLKGLGYTIKIEFVKED